MKPSRFLITMSNHGASSGGRQTNQKTILDLTSKPRLVNNERYVGTILSHKNVKLVAIQNVLKLVWARYEKFRISELEDKIMLFEFENQGDKDQIFDLSPWSIQVQCLSLHK